MCIMALALEAQPDFPFILCFNRDERFSRPTSQLARQADGLICALDLQAGGTWLAVNSASGSFAALTNVRAEMPTGLKLQSRGQLLKKVLVGDHDAIDSPAYAAYNLVHGVIRLDTPMTLMLSSSTPADRGTGAWGAKHETVCGVVGRPVILTKTNDSSGLFTSEDTGCGDAAWPKAVWLRLEVQRLLQSSVVPSGVAGAQELLELLVPAMSCTTLPAAYAAQAETAKGQYSHAPGELERRFQRGTCITPFDLNQKEGVGEDWYGTVSQTFLFVCRSERCAWLVYREMAAPDPLETESSSNGTWQWERIAID